MDICLHLSNTNKQLAFLRDYLDHTAKATKCKVLAEDIAKPTLKLADIYGLLFSSNWLIVVMRYIVVLRRIIFALYAYFCRRFLYSTATNIKKTTKKHSLLVFGAHLLGILVVLREIKLLLFLPAFSWHLPAILPSAHKTAILLFVELTRGIFYNL